MCCVSGAGCGSSRRSAARPTPGSTRPSPRPRHVTRRLGPVIGCWSPLTGQWSAGRSVGAGARSGAENAACDGEGCLPVRGEGPSPALGPRGCFPRPLSKASSERRRREGEEESPGGRLPRSRGMGLCSLQLPWSRGPRIWNRPPEPPRPVWLMSRAPCGVECGPRGGRRSKDCLVTCRSRCLTAESSPGPVQVVESAHTSGT